MGDGVQSIQKRGVGIVRQSDEALNRFTYLALVLCLLGIIPLTLTGCESGSQKRLPVTPQPMSCAGNIPAQITLYTPEEAKLIFEGKSYNLKRAPSASGIKYSNSDVTYWNKGIDALIIRADGTTTNCTYIPKAGL